MLPQHYPIETGTLYGGEYPGHRKPAMAQASLRRLMDIGIRTFIDLTSPCDELEPYEGILADLTAESGIALRRISLPIADMDTADSDEAMRKIMDSIRESVRAAPAVYIHCWLGIGRTGTMAGCWLRECGLGPEEAMGRVQPLYSSHMAKARTYPESPQTRSQKDAIRFWRTSR